MNPRESLNVESLSKDILPKFVWNASYSTVRLGTSLQLICVAGSGYDVLKCVLTWQFTAYSVSCVLVHLVSVLSGHGGQLQFNVGSLCAVTFNFIYRAFTVSVDKFVGICNQVWWYVCVTCFTWESVGFYLTPCKQSLRKWVHVWYSTCSGTLPYKNGLSDCVRGYLCLYH